jgi:hypothetical protein
MEVASVENQPEAAVAVLRGNAVARPEESCVRVALLKTVKSQEWYWHELVVKE